MPLRLHVFGDSLTAGIADVWTNRQLLPWPRILADGLRDAGIDVVIASDAARVGASSREILTEQVAGAGLRRGDLACLWAGANDTLRSKYTIAHSRAALGDLFDVVADSGAVPLTMELPRISSALPGPRWAMRAWDAQGALVNELVRERSAALGGIHVSWPGDGVAGPDGTHLSQAGHYFYAARYARQIAARAADGRCAGGLCQDTGVGRPAAGRADGRRSGTGDAGCGGAAMPRIEIPAGLPSYSAADRRRWYLKHGWLWLIRRRFDKRRARA